MVVIGRFVFALAAFVLAVLAGVLFATVITANGATWLHFVQIGLLIVCCVWLAWGFNTAVAGIFFSRAHKRRRAGVLPAVSRNRTAILMPVYNEDAGAVMARVAAMLEGLRRIRRLAGFDFFVLSDSTRADCVDEERRTVFEVAGALETGTHLYYRHREKNTNRKAGNVAEFVTQQGGAYEYMLVLDADSLMRPETMVEMVARMDDDQELALLQTQPLIINRSTIFGRALQFSAALYSPFFSRGIAALQGREGPFWGHNAIIRIRAFAQSCGLPHLPGVPPFGGHILSHDFVEAALLAREGWKVRVEPDLEGSFEEAPSNLIEYAKRDRRWCQGNLQHGLLIGAPRLSFWSRVAMICGIMAYAASPIWLMFLIVSMLDPILATAPNYFPTDSLFPVFPRPETGKALLLLLGIFTLLLLPKTLIAFRTALSHRAKRFGGGIAVLMGATCELILTSALAPIMMLFQSKAVAEILMARDSGWPSTDRDDEGLPLSTAFAASWWMVIAGAVLLSTTFIYATNLFLWMLPIGLPLVVSPFFISLTGNPALGRIAQRLSIFATPFEIAPEPVILASYAWRDRLARSASTLSSLRRDSQPGPTLTVAQG
ncbi:glucans biosynthesis glucosyltransferase MdoH [Aureimonas fodinaquatilis]|uniref:glucans biosynthesis glucosyltransferase MdoH n=1 Tax=Aureimonas fodinaquatilis TaxID=2565783 RepID=UPI001FE37326|nr:glucans biosynthesis glucosyltransferase MdoH [Aureimonas fodinaquatilis]